MFFKSVFTDESDFHPDFNLNVKYSIEHAGPILEKEAYIWFFRKRAKRKGAKNDKVFENLGKNVQNFKIFWKKATCGMDVFTQK